MTNSAYRSAKWDGETRNPALPDGGRARDVDRERRDPERHAEIAVDERAGERDERRDEEPRREMEDRGLVRRVVAEAPDVERELDEADDEVGEREAKAVVAEGVRQRDRHEEACARRGPSTAIRTTMLSTSIAFVIHA